MGQILLIIGLNQSKLFNFIIQQMCQKRFPCKVLVFSTLLLTIIKRMPSVQTKYLVWAFYCH